ncbi:MAG: glycosyltransferase WbuB [Rhodocyclaceae bacterium]|nr:MAG: glycosyltransferase WbuB [Rhodocyclaceae bacterium]
MHILFISQYFYPENFRINDLVDALAGRGHEITVLTGLPNYPSGRIALGYGWQGPWTETIGAARVYRVPLLPRGDGGGLRLLANYCSFVISAAWAVQFRLPRRVYDAIFVFEPSPITVGLVSALARRRFGVPVLFWILDLWPKSLQAVGVVSSPGVLALVDRLVKWIYRRCDLLLVQSEAFCGELNRQGVEPGKVRYFPNWGEAAYEAALEIPDDDAKVRRVTGERPFRIVFAGNIGAAQDFPAIIDAAGRLRDAYVEWVIAGDGRAATEAHARVAALGLEDKVRFLGQQPNEAMPALFRTADALLLSLRDEPIFALTVPGKLQSYLTAGRPVLGMISGEGARIIEESGGGLACPAGDAAGLERSVRVLLSADPAARREMGERGQAYYREHFSRDRLLDRLESWFREARGAGNDNRK